MQQTLTAKRYARGAALVAGGSGGLGGAICRSLATAGAHVALTYHRNEARAQEVAQDVKALGRRVTIHQVDLRDAQAVSELVRGLRDEFGGVHTAVYAAGPMIPIRHISKLEPVVFREMVATDIFGCFNLVHATLPELRETQGVLLAMATPAIKRYAKTDILSAAPKAAIEALVRGVAVEEGRFGVRANCVAPGLVGDDGILRHHLVSGDFSQQMVDTTIQMTSLRRLGTAQEIANVVVFLASDLASYVTGQFVMADGGLAL